MVTTLNIDQLRIGNTNPCIFPLIDLSIYNPDLPVENAYLEITPPGYYQPIQLPYFPGNVTLVTTQNLRLTAGLEEMDSGIYIVVQTIKPNDRLRKTTYIFNTASERALLTNLVCEAIADCKDTDELMQLHAALDLVEMLAIAEKCKEANKLFNLTYDKLLSLCAECAKPRPMQRM